MDLVEGKGRPERDGDLPGPADVYGVVAVPFSVATPLRMSAIVSARGGAGRSLAVAYPSAHTWREFSRRHQFDARRRGVAYRAGRGCHHRLGHLGVDLGHAFPFPRQGTGVLAPDPADLVQAYFDSFPVEQGIATVVQSGRRHPLR